VRDGADRWMLRITDDGVGAAGARATASRGIGVRSVVVRLRLHHGVLAACTVASSGDAGYAVTLTLPYDLDDEG
jgi:signal transduction histidine kinase